MTQSPIEILIKSPESLAHFLIKITINVMNMFLSSQQSPLPLQWLHDRLTEIRDRINQIEITNPQIAQLICKLIPSSCPFAKTIKLFGKTILVIPPLCHLNPLYEEFMGLRFRALSLLSDTNLNY
jgi:hypothetical protein